MKYLIALGVIAIIFYLLLYWRFRRYIPVARRIFGIARDLYRLTKGSESVRPATRAASRSEGDKLVRCAACGTWIPEGRSIKLRARSYCSQECLEGAEATNSKRQKTAGRQ